MRILVLVALLVVVATPAVAEMNRPSITVGYVALYPSLVGEGFVPLGGFLSLSSPSTTVGKVGFELDGAYHRDLEDQRINNTVIVVCGPRIQGNRRSFLRFLVGLRHDSWDVEQQTTYGGVMGFGVDVPGSRAFFRLAVDYQIFFETGEGKWPNYQEELRLSAGIGF